MLAWVRLYSNESLQQFPLIDLSTGPYRSRNGYSFDCKSLHSQYWYVKTSTIQSNSTIMELLLFKLNFFVDSDYKELNIVLICAGIVSVAVSAVFTYQSKKFIE